VHAGVSGEAFDEVAEVVGADFAFLCGEDVSLVAVDTPVVDVVLEGGIRGAVEEFVFDGDGASFVVLAVVDGDLVALPVDVGEFEVAEFFVA